MSADPMEPERQLRTIAGIDNRLKETGMTTVQDTSGFLVADARGRTVGRVECSMYGTAPDEPDALGRFF
jgi:hypothetical protein